MKKIYSAMLIGLAALTACTDDDSTYGTDTHYINISGIEESYNGVSFSGEELHISPNITSSFGDGDLEYLWTCYNNADDQNLKYDDNWNPIPIHIDTIGHDHDLNFPIALTDGVYHVLLTVTSRSTGYSQQLRTTLNTSSVLSNGFYVLKETSDGNTDIDLYNPTLGEVVTDIITTNQGQPIAGRPRKLDVVHQMAFIDEETGQKSGANTLCITTENNEVRWIRALDCKTVMDAASCHYEAVNGEIPYRTVRGYWTCYFVTSNGVYTAQTPYMDSSGIYGAFGGTGGSTHVCGGSFDNYFGIVYWAEQTGSLESSDFNGTYSPVYSEVEGVGAEGLNYDCLYSGLSSAAGDYFYYLFADKANPEDKYLYTLQPSMMGATIVSVRKVDPESHYAKASLRAISAKQATIGYAVDNNKVYSYNLVNVEAEKELSFVGLPADEQITFISNRTYSSYIDQFDYLIVGTQTGTAYRLYFYNTIGGEPDGAPAFTISGTGRLKSLSYVDPNAMDMSDESCGPWLDE